MKADTNTGQREHTGPAGRQSSSPAGKGGEPQGCGTPPPLPLPLVATTTEDNELVQMEARRLRACEYTGDFAVFLIVGRGGDPVAVRVPRDVCSNCMEILAPAADAGWSLGLLAAEVCRMVDMAEIVTPPTRDEYLNHDENYCTRQRAHGGEVVWRPPNRWLDAWGATQLVDTLIQRDKDRREDEARSREIESVHKTGLPGPG